MRIGIVCAAPAEIALLHSIVTAGASHQLAWVVSTGEEALAHAARDAPDIVLVDLALPDMDGVEATRRLAANARSVIIVVTATAEARSAKVYEAIGAGAFDVIAVPSMAGDGSVTSAALLDKLATIERMRTPAVPHRVITPSNGPAPADPTSRRWSVPLVAIGASAGGPPALGTILSQLPASFPGAVIIIQHMDAQFVDGMATWLAAQSTLTVRVACDGDRPIPSAAFIAGGGTHLVIDEAGILRTVLRPHETTFRPSIDVFFQSMAAHWRGPGIGVLLTGMGRDGAAGLMALRDAGMTTITQDRATSVVYGMPKAATELGAASETLPLESIARRVVQLCTPPTLATRGSLNA